MIDIKKTYEYLFNISLNVVKGYYDKEKPYDDLEKCCKACNSHKEQLLGMLRLMEELKVITYEEYNIESEKIFDTFSTHKLFNAYVED